MAEEGNVIFTFGAPGALAADWVLTLTLQHAFMPRQVSVVGGNASDATIKIGTDADDDALMAAKDFGDSGVPAVYVSSDFADPDYQFAKGSVLKITIDFDGAAGTPVTYPVVVISGLLGA